MEDETYDFTVCIKEKLSETVGCRLPWDKWSNQDRVACERDEDFRKFEQIYSSLVDEDVNGIERKTGCRTPCRYKEFRFVVNLNILRWGILISRYINIAHPGYNTIFLSCMPLSRIQNSPNSIFDLVFHFWDQLNTFKNLTNSAQLSVIIMNSTKYIFKALLLLMKKIQCTSADSRHQPGCCC